MSCITTNTSTSIIHMHNGSEQPALALSVDFGTVTVLNDPPTWAIGLIRDPVVNYTKPDGSTQSRSPYFRTRYSTDEEAVRQYRSFSLFVEC